MAKITVWFGAALIVLGVVSYVGSGAASVTALIPTFIGIVFAALGLAGQTEQRRALMMHLAAVLALLAFAGSAMALVDLPNLLAGDDDVDRPWAVAARSIMAVAMLVYLVLAVRSFIVASLQRGGQPASPDRPLPTADGAVCPHCREAIQPDARVCKHCGWRFGLGLQTSQSGKASGAAIASLVFGILMLGGLGSLLAVILGHAALSDIKRTNEQLGGRGIAIAGLILGYVGLAAVAALVVFVVAA